MKSYRELTQWHPLQLGIVILGVGLGSMLLVYSLSNNPSHVWMGASSTLLFFGVLSPSLGVFQTNWLIYTAWSSAIFGLMMAICYGAGKILAGQTLMQQVSPSSLFILLLVFYLMLLSLAGLFRLILQWIQETE